MINKTIERIKMAVIVVLFMSTILLLYLLWTPQGGVDFAGLIGRRGRTASLPEAKGLIQAGFAVSGNGSGSFTRSEDTDGDIQEAAMAELEGFLAQSYVESASISREQYELAMSGWPSVRISYDAELPFSAFCAICSPESALSIRDDVMMKTLSFSEAAADSVFVTDAEGNTQRFVFGEARDSVELLLSQFGDDSVPCYAAKDLLGHGDAMLALTGESGLRRISASNESADSDFGTDAARGIFGDTFSFVRRMVDSFGNITYMYGYGDKNLYLYTDGGTAYSASEEGALQTGFAEDLDTALGFAAVCGGLSEDEWGGMRLTGYSESGSRIKTRVFEFSQTAGGRAVFGAKGPALRITVTGGSVTELAREGLKYSAGSADELRQTISPANVIANNSHHIYNVLHGSVLAAASDEAFEYAAGETESLTLGYFADPLQGGAELIPCWVLRSRSGVRFYFDLYEGTPLGYSD
ncbi:MAG: hypothetical protein II971_07405 [Firmicutes bacterium]|nr:hypothetical protein [Bacillota bacterium]